MKLSLNIMFASVLIILVKCTVPNDWICEEDWYSAGDGCDCDCGAYDPDCDSSSAIYNCPVDPDHGYAIACNITGICIYNLTHIIERQIPENWRCEASFYDSDDGCDCNCGAIDPDCVEGAEVFGCHENYICQNGSCVINQPVPIEWTCSNDYFGQMDGCDCACGAEDPDCQISGQEVMNCPCSGMTCESGVCTGQCNGVYYGVPKKQDSSSIENSESAALKGWRASSVVLIVMLGGFSFPLLMIVICCLLFCCFCNCVLVVCCFIVIFVDTVRKFGGIGSKTGKGGLVRLRDETGDGQSQQLEESFIEDEQ